MKVRLRASWPLTLRKQENVGYAAASEENKVYSWLLSQVGWILRFSDEQKALRPASEPEYEVIDAAQHLRILTQAHLESAATIGYGPEYIQTLQKLRAELMRELDEFI